MNSKDMSLGQFMHHDRSQMLTAADCVNQAETVVFSFFASKL